MNTFEARMKICWNMSISASNKVLLYINIVAFYDTWIQIYFFVRWSAVKKKHVYLLTKTPSALIERPSYKKMESEWDLTDVNILLIILLFKISRKIFKV